MSLVDTIALLLGYAFKCILFQSPHLLSILNIDKQKRLFSLRPVDIIGKVSNNSGLKAHTKMRHKALAARCACTVHCLLWPVVFKLISLFSLANRYCRWTDGCTVPRPGPMHSLLLSAACPYNIHALDSHFLFI